MYATLDLNQWFEGVNLDFMVYLLNPNERLEIPRSKNDNKIVENNAENLFIAHYSTVSEEDKLTLDFITNKNKIMNFFEVNGVLVLFDSLGYLSVIDKFSKSIYDRKPVATYLDCKPDYYIEYHEPYLIYECLGLNELRLGVTKLMKTEPSKGSKYYTEFYEKAYLKTYAKPGNPIY